MQQRAMDVQSYQKPWCYFPPSLPSALDRDAVGAGGCSKARAVTPRHCRMPDLDVHTGYWLPAVQGGVMRSQ